MTQTIQSPLLATTSVGARHHKLGDADSDLVYHVVAIPQPVLEMAGTTGRIFAKIVGGRISKLQSATPSNSNFHTLRLLAKRPNHDPTYDVPFCTKELDKAGGQAASQHKLTDGICPLVDCTSDGVLAFTSQITKTGTVNNIFADVSIVIGFFVTGV